MKIMSINLCSWGTGELSIPNRAPRAAALIEKYKPDLIGVQEGTPWWMAYLKANLHEYSSIGVGREEKGQGETSAIFFRKEIFDLKDGETFWLSETPDTVSKGWDGMCIRICTRATLLRISDGKEFCCFNTHLDHVGNVAQIMGVRLINEYIKKYQGMPIIFTGDFNVTPESDAYHEVCLKDARVVSGFSKNCGTWHAFGELDDASAKLIDYCFISDEITVKDYRVITDKVNDQFVSDHYPILVEVE